MEGLGKKTLGEGDVKGEVVKEVLKVWIAESVLKPPKTPPPPPAEGLGKGLEGVGPRNEADTLKEGVGNEVSVPSLVALPNPAAALPLPVGDTLGEREEEEEFVESMDGVGDREER